MGYEVGMLFRWETDYSFWNTTGQKSGERCVEHGTLCVCNTAQADSWNVATR